MQHRMCFNRSNTRACTQTVSNTATCTPLKQWLQFVKGDIQSMDLLGFVLSSECVDTVMHFAAQVSMVTGHTDVHDVSI